MTDSSNKPETTNDLEATNSSPVSHKFAHACCQPSELIGDHWLEMTATIPLKRTEDFAAWMDRQLAIAELELASFASPRSTVSNR